jgi:hypothetical protein
MVRLKERAVELARRAVKGAAAAALHYSGARELLSAAQRRAVGGRRVLIISYHRVVADFAEEKDRSIPTLNVEQRTFRRHLQALQETHDIVSLDDALSVLDGSRGANRDVAVITFDDGYRDVYTHAFPVMRDMRVPGVVYVPSAFVGTGRALGHDRLHLALKRMEARGISAMAVGVGGEGQRCSSTRWKETRGRRWRWSGSSSAIPRRACSSWLPRWRIASASGRRSSPTASCP